MLIRHIGLRLKGFYRMAPLAQQMEGHDGHLPPNKTQKRPHSGTNAASMPPHDAVSLEQGSPARVGKASAPHDRSSAPRTCRCRDWPPRLGTEIRRLNTVFPNPGKEQALSGAPPPARTPRTEMPRCAYDCSTNACWIISTAIMVSVRAGFSTTEPLGRCLLNTCLICLICGGLIQALANGGYNL